ncbi:MAG TPA: DUF1329 domain-containing protein [Myxococcota bacterium]|nr:DUF1329 domain-containing protein [Myxococcota bacterium]HRY96229.1 DUF1329 domain-containing protein [Myxococcota bacterium]
MRTKSIALVGVLLLSFGTALAGDITAENWGEKVGFAPDPALTALAKKGVTVSAQNLAEFKALVPPGMKLLIEKYNLSMPLKPYEPMHPSTGYVEATNKYLGQAKIKDVGGDYRARGIDGYVAGLPFPQPKTGLEVAWDYQYAYMGDDGDSVFSVYWISAKSGVEHKELWRWAFIIRTVNRTDIAPIPAIKSFLDKGLQYTSITYALEPYDKKGFGALYSRSVDPLDQQGHIYVPAMRRVLRNTFGTRGDTWNSTDLLYEDVRGYMGYPEWMNWEIKEKATLLMPVAAEVPVVKDNAERVFDLKSPPYWNPKLVYQPRPTYVLEVKPKFPDYPYQRMVFYIDAETYVIVYKEAYDKKGDLWKMMLMGWNAPTNMNTHPPVLSVGLVVDLQAEHATLIDMHKSEANLNLDQKMFTLSNLQKRGK